MGTQNTAVMSRADLIRLVTKITGNSSLWWLPTVSETTTSTDVARPTGFGKTLTYSKDISTWDTPPKILGAGINVTFDGVDEEADTPDAADLTYALVPMSILAIVNPTDATSSGILAKFDATTGAEAREFLFELDSSDKLLFELWDESANAKIGKQSSAAVTQAEWQMLCGTYAGGAVSSGVLLYKNGVLIPSVASETGTFVAVENLTTIVQLGMHTGASAIVNFFDGSMATVMLVNKVLTAQNQLDLKDLFNEYFDLSM